MYEITDNGVLKTVESWVVVIPLFDNDGKQFGENVIDEILQQILLDYPGFSLSNIIGYWKGEKETYKDNNCEVVIDTVPDNTQDSSKFFVSLKQQLQVRLKQEKIYIKKQLSNQELLTFDEFFSEVGVQAQSSDLKNEAKKIVSQLVSNWNFVMQRMGYETTVISRNAKERKIIWERKLCGIKIRTELDDTFPSEIKIIAADQVIELGEALARNESFAIIGNYEFLSYILEKSSYRSLVDANNLAEISTQYLSPTKQSLNVKRFIEEFTMSVFNNVLILRDEGFLPEEIKINVGSDGSMQFGSNQKGSILLGSPATIPEKEVQIEILRCLKIAFELLEDNSIDNIAVLQAKAKNNYILKRAFVRHTLRNI